MNATKRGVFLAYLGVLVALPGLATASLPLYDGFETYLGGISLNGSNGWLASSSGFAAQGSTVWSPLLGGQAAALPPGATVSNALVSPCQTNVWIDFFVTNAVPAVAGTLTPEDVDANLTAMWYVETNGCPVMWHPVSNAWLVCSNDYWGTATLNFNTNAWMRFTLCENYSNKTVALFLNGHLLLQHVRFINTNLQSSAFFGIAGAYGATSYFDEVSARYVPTNMVADLDNDGMADADEIQNYGSVGICHRPLITVLQPATGWIAPSNTFDVMPASSTNFVFHADIAYCVTQVYTNGQSVGDFTGQNTRDATWLWANIISNGLSDGTVSATVSYVAQRYVPQDGYATIQAAMAAALPGDTIFADSGPYAGGVVLSNGVNLVGTNVILSGSLTVNAGSTAFLAGCSGLVAGNTIINGSLVISNGTIDLGTVVLGADGVLQVVNATALIINGASRSGSFTVDASWSATKSQTLPFQDDFERYTEGAALSRQQNYGWSADADVLIQTAKVWQGSKAVGLPANTFLSNLLAPVASSNVWVEWNFQEAARIDASTAELDPCWTNAAVVLFLNTNGYVTVFDPQMNAFTVISNDVWGGAVAQVATSDWPRIALNLNYSSRMAAVFLNGRLMKEQLRFINTNQANCARLEWNAGTAGSTYLDALNVQTNGANIMSDDANRNGRPDAVEIDLYGCLNGWRGSIFTIR